MRCLSHCCRASLALCRRVACPICKAWIASLLSCSIRSRTRLLTFSPGVFPSPEAATTADHNVVGTDHELDARMRRAVPIRLDAMPNNGRATWSTSTPAPLDARLSKTCQGGVETSIGNSGRSPRRSSRIDQSGSAQSPAGSVRGRDRLASPLGLRELRKVRELMLIGFVPLRTSRQSASLPPLDLFSVA